MLPVKDTIPTDRLPVVTLALIAAGVVAGFALHPHVGSVYLAGELLVLWWFGVSVEDATSRPRFLVFCLLGGGCAIGLQAALDPGASAPATGAAGAVAGVVGGYLVLYPRARVVSIAFVPFAFTLVELPAWVLAGAWLLLQAAFAATSSGNGGVAYLAQAGGLAFGLLAIRAFAQRRKRVPPPAAARPAEAVLP